MSSAARSDAPIGAMLRDWRAARRLSQLRLSLDTGISARHLSYLETGRSRPSREMVLRLAEAFGATLRERNALLVAAGFAPRHRETSLMTEAMAPIRRALDLMLAHQEPYPAFVLDRHWNVLMSNRASERCTRFLLGRNPDDPNMLRLCLRPDGLRHAFMNFDEIAGDLLRHLQHQVAASPWDAELKALLDEVLGYQGMPASGREHSSDTPPSPLLLTTFRKDDVTLRFFSTITRFGSPHDVTLEELHVECSYPADAATAAECARRFGGD